MTDSRLAPGAVIALLLLDGVLAVALSVRLSTATRPSSPAIVFFVMLALGGIAGLGLWRGQAWAVWLGLVASGGSVFLAADVLLAQIASGSVVGIARYGLRVATSGFVFARLANLLRRR
jgi:uncharacterized membrane protein (DUF2068 family)